MTRVCTLLEVIRYREAQLARELDRELDRPAPDWKRTDRLARLLVRLRALPDEWEKRAIDTRRRRAYIAA